MNIPLIIVLKDFILYCDENNIEEPNTKDIEDYVTSCHYDFFDTIEDFYSVKSFENAVTELLTQIFNLKLYI